MKEVPSLIRTRGAAEGGFSRAWWLCLVVLILCGAAPCWAQAPSVKPALPTGLTFSINGLPQPDDLDLSVRIVGALTILSLAPSLLILTTCFPRILIVFSLARNALASPERFRTSWWWVSP